MTTTADLMDIATEEFDRRFNAAEDAVNSLSRFWTKLYGPNEALTDAQEALGAIWDEWHNSADGA